MNRFFRKQNSYSQTALIEPAIYWVDEKAKKFALYLSVKTKNVQHKRMGIVIILSCVLLSVCLGLLIFKVTLHGTSLHVANIRAPAIRFNQPSPQIKFVLNRIRSVHRSLDSLAINDTATYKNIMKSHPHLMDSIRMVERFSNE